MQNDAKLGLVAGVAGVVVAGVLFSQPPQPSPQPLRAKAAVVAPATPASVSLPSAKPEAEARPVSRTRTAE